MSRHLILYLGAVLATVFCNAACSCLVDDQTLFQGDIGNDQICGARCAMFVIGKLNGTAPDLIEVVRTFQHNSNKNPQSMETIRQYLTLSHLAAESIRIEKPNEQLRLECSGDVQIIAHLHGANDGVGHFIVWIETTGAGDQTYWDGLNGVQVMPSSVFRQRFSGALLIAGKNSQALRSGFKISATNNLRSFVAVLFGIGSLFLGAFLVVPLFRKEQR